MIQHLSSQKITGSPTGGDSTKANNEEGKHVIYGQVWNTYWPYNNQNPPSGKPDSRDYTGLSPKKKKETEGQAGRANAPPAQLCIAYLDYGRISLYLRSPTRPSNF